MYVMYFTSALLFCAVCNVTIDSMTLMKQSGKTFGQIKSRVLEGPAACWYAFVPSQGQRVELQIYRLVSVGRFNGSACEGGSLRVAREANEEEPEFELCGANERYDPPVVLFSEPPAAVERSGERAHATTLLFAVDERTVRSQFLAYFSFTATEATGTLAYQPRGGTRLHNTRCDWLYQDVACRTSATPCVLASPGYPGVYPPARLCNYHVTTSSMSTRVRLVLTSLLLPHGRCATDYVAVYQGTTRHSPRLHTFCAGGRRAGAGRGGAGPQHRLEYSGPNLLVEFSSGPSQPPFDYNGFTAELWFEEGGVEVETAVAPHAIVPTAIEPRPQPSVLPPPAILLRGNCDVVLYENESRSGHFDTRGHDWSQLCRFVFRGRATDVVHVSLFNYKLRARSCNTVVEIWDGDDDGVGGGGRHKPPPLLYKICSPQTRNARDHGGSFLGHQTYVSSGPSLTLSVRRTGGGDHHDVLEFLDGAYLFHDEEQLGTLQPSTMCDVSFYGLSSPSGGMVTNPGGQHLYWNVEGALRCAQHFVPGANQSVSLIVRRVGAPTSSQSGSGAACHTRCGDGGCECAPDAATDRPYDHLSLVSEDGRTLACLCGARLVDAGIVPVTVRTWTQLTLVYSLAGYSWNTKGFDFTATYAFERDSSCGLSTVMAQSGELKGGVGRLDNSANSTSSDINHFYHQNCVWILDSNVERQLFIELSSNQSRPCAAWNISLHEYSADGGAGHVGDMLYTFCPRDVLKTYSLPWKLNTVVVRLRVMSRTPPQYRIKWRSQVVRANTRLASPTPAPNAATSDYRSLLSYLPSPTSLVLAALFVL